MEKKSKYLISPKDIAKPESIAKDTTSALDCADCLRLQGSSLPSPPADLAQQKQNSHRLWIGNVDTRLSEFTLLKLLQKFGDLEKFDFLYHKSGPDQGKPRGYCFATYANKQQAEAAKRGMNGKLALGKRLIVRSANSEKKDADQKSTQGQPSQNMDRASQIRAIEAKLQMMEQGLPTNPEPVDRATASTSGRSDNRDSGAQMKRTKPYSHSKTR